MFMHMRQFLTGALIVLAVSGCDLLGGKCTYELRSYSGQGNAIQGGAAAATANVGLSEERGSVVGQSFSWLVTGGLKGHITSASIKDSQNPNVVLLDLPVLGPDRDPILEGNADSRQGAVLGGFHDILAANRAGIELKTDDQANPTVIIPITTVSAGNWIRPYCS
jgi:hypothetical protein